jgi:outer membrane protein insertion porin family
MKKFLLLIAFLFTATSHAEIVKNLNVIGNERINIETIKVYGNISINKNYDPVDLDKVLKSLYSTEFFEDVSLDLKNGSLTITVKEYPVINDIDIEGEKANKIKEAVLDTLKLKEKESFIKSKLSEDISGIQRIYASMGFNFTKVKTKIEKFSGNRVNLLYVLEKGSKTSISKINFIGDKKIRDRRLRDVIVSEEDKFWKFISRNTSLSSTNIDLDKRLLSNYYKSLGYYDVQVVSSNAEISSDNKTTLTYNINAGIRYRITKISTDVSSVFDKKLFSPLEKDFNKNIGKYYSPFRVKKLLDEVDTLIINNDLQFIEHSVNEIISGESIEVKINIYEGRKELVERVNVIGNSVTNEDVIRSELLLDEGDPFNKLKLDRSIAKLKARNIFGEVTEKVSAGSSSDLKVIDITVEEKPTGEISAGAGIGTSGGSFAFNVSENNWLGRGIKLTTFVEASTDTLKGALSVINPNYNYSGNAVSFQMSNQTNDKPDSGFKNNISSVGVATKFEQYKNVYLAPSIDFTYDDLQVQNSASDGLKKQAGSFTDLTFSYGISLDNRDKAYNPTDGYISTFSQALPVIATAPFMKNVYSFKKYNSFGRNVIGAFKFHASAINGFGEDVRISKRLKLPTSKLRGFEAGKVGPKDGDDFIGGNYSTAINLETSLPNLLPESTKTDVDLFLDLGNIWGVDYTSAIDDSNEIRSTAGVNINWSSPVGPMNFTISQNITKAKTDKPQSFNFRLGTTF